MSNLIGQTVGRYHIIEQLGQGGMATVYRAYDTRLKREVAFKVIRSDIATREQADLLYKRFEREAVSLAKLSHPNIVSVFDYGEYEGYPYLVMEFVDGGSLRQRLAQHIPWKDAVRLIIPIAHALEYAHKRKLVHRDIKPANILISASDTPKLTDFGIAKILEPGEVALTGTGVGIGTPEYMSPEQGMGKPVDHRTDIYSLGVVLYEMVTGKKPYVADTPIAVMLKHIKDPLPRPKNIMPDLPEELERVIFVALAKNPEDRYQDMESFAHSLERLLMEENQPAVSQEAATLVQKPGAGTAQVARTATAYPPAGAATRTAPPLGTQPTPPPVMNYQQVPAAQSLPGTTPYPATATVPQAPAKKAKWGWLMGIGGVIVALLCLVITASGGYYFYQQKQSQDKTATAEARRSTERAREKTSQAATQAALRDLYVYNNSNRNICYFYIADAGSSDWGNDLLKGDIIYPNSGYTFEKIEPGEYDLIAEDCSNNIINTLYNVDFPDDTERWDVVAATYCGDGTCDAGEDASNCPSDCGGTIALNLYNNTPNTICYVYYGPPNSTSWTADLLGSSTLSSYTTFTAYLPAGVYAIQAIDCNSNVVYSQTSMSIYSDMDLTLGSGTGSQGSSGTVNLYIVNDTDVTICYIRYSAGGAPSWAGDLLGSSVLGAYETFTAPLSPGEYDLQAEDCNGHTMQFESYVSVYNDTYWYVEGYCGNGTCESWETSTSCSSDCGSSSGSVSLTIYNQTSRTVCYIYYSPAGASSWTGDLLGSSVLSASSSFTAYLSPGSYDLRAEDCSHNFMAGQSGYSVYTNTTWYIY